VLVLTVLAAFSIINTHDGGHFARIRKLDIPLAVIGAACSIFLTRFASFSPELAASAIGLVGALLLRKVTDERDYYIAPVFFGAFVGTTSEASVHEWPWLFIGVVLGGALWSMSRHAWVGIGGKIGAMAIIGSYIARTTYRLADHHSSAPKPSDLNQYIPLLLGLAIVSSLITFYLNNNRRMGPVLASSTVTLIASFIIFVIDAKNNPHATACIAIVFGSSFVGMTQSERLLRPFIAIPVASIIYYFLASHVGAYFAGLGGELGITALVAVFATRGAEALDKTLRRNLRANESKVDHIRH
jgi:hypothetical protein